MKKKIIGMEWANDGLHVWRDGEELSLAWTFTPQSDPASFLDEIKKFLDKNRLRGASVSLALARSEMYVGSFPLPGNKMISNGSVGIPSDRLKSFRTVLESAGLRILGIGLSPAAIVPALSVHGLVDSSQVSAVLDAGPLYAQLLICQNNTLLFSRTFPVTQSQEEAQKSVRYFCDQEKISLLSITEIKPRRPVLAAEGQTIMFQQRNGFWLVEPKSSNRKENMLAALSLVFVSGSLALGHMKQATTQAIFVANEERRHSVARTPHGTVTDIATPIFWSVARAVPNGMFLRDLTYDADRRIVFLKGQASDYGLVSKLSAQLADSKIFKKTKTDRSSLVSLGNRKVVEFSLQGFL